jgi:hypothetical protein
MRGVPARRQEASELRHRLVELQAFAMFRATVEREIRKLPTIVFESSGLAGHRARVFASSPSVDVVVSERDVWNYVRFFDLLVHAKRSGDSARLIADYLLLRRGAELLLRNRFAGLSYLSRGFKGPTLITFEPPERSISNAIEGVGAGRVHSILFLFYPLAHEIGHTAEGQALCPPVLRSDEILETYAINYRVTRASTGDFDYHLSLEDQESPLYLPTLREEAASDFFAIACVTDLLGRLTAGTPFPVEEITLGLHLFPLFLALDRAGVKDVGGLRDFQSLCLATRCRFTLVTDSTRACIKHLFRERMDRRLEAEIDRRVGHAVEEAEEYYTLAMTGLVDFVAETHAIGDPDNARVLQDLREATTRDLGQRLDFANYLDEIADDADIYPIDGANSKYLRQYGNTLRKFSEIQVDAEGHVIGVKS